MRCHTMRLALLLTFSAMHSAGLVIADVALAQDAVADAVAWVEIDGAEPAANDENAMLDAMFEQMRPLLVVELSFAKRSAKLDEAQMGKLIPECRTAFREYLKKQMNGNNNQRQIRNGAMIFFGGGNAGMNQSPDQSQRQLSERITDELKEIATDEQVASYESELKARDEYRKQATIAQIVAMYDEVLLFTDEQRQQVKESLSEKWDDSWASNVEALQQYGAQYYPNLPNNLIEPHLTREQELRYTSLQKVSASMGIGTNMYGTQLIDDVDVSVKESKLEVPAEATDEQ